MLKLMFYQILFLHLITLIVAHNPPSDHGEDVNLFIKTLSGPIQGIWQTNSVNESEKFAAWYGIPYAEPPVEELRFKVIICNY